jgi:hypothetical protein
MHSCGLLPRIYWTRSQAMQPGNIFFEALPRIYAPHQSQQALIPRIHFYFLSTLKLPILSLPLTLAVNS